MFSQVCRHRVKPAYCTLHKIAIIPHISIGNQYVIPIIFIFFYFERNSLMTVYVILHVLYKAGRYQLGERINAPVPD